MTLPLKVLSKKTALVLDHLTEGLAVGDSRKVDGGTGYMPVHVECLQRTGLGLLYSIAHYYEQNGDLVAAPDVVFVRAAEGWSPISFQNSIAYRVAVDFHADGTIEVDARQHRDLAEFCNDTFMPNIEEQQALPTRRSR